MDSIYLVCAIAGGSLVVLQFVLSLLGGDTDTAFDGDLDGGFDHDGFDGDAGDAFVKLLSIKTVVAGIAFFGVGGYASRQFGLSPMASAGIASGAGLAAVYIMAQIMAALGRLQSRGNVDLQNALGTEAKCYLRIPAKGTGTGRVTVTLQGRQIECKAVSNGGEIPTGAIVRVLSLRNPTTLEVAGITS